MSAKSTPIQRKLLRVILLTSGAVLLLNCIAFFVYEYFNSRNLSVRELSTLGQIIASNSTASLAFDAPDDATEILSALKTQKHIRGACLYDNNGKMFAVYAADTTVVFPKSVDKGGYAFNGRFLEGFEPVIQGEKQLGYLYLQSDTNALYNRFALYGLIALLFIAVSFLFAYLLSKRLQRSISDPILELAQKAELVSEKGDYSVRVQKRSDDELGILTGAFNHMLTQIQRQNDEIHTLNANLEEKVIIRTTELQEANLALTENNELIKTIIDSSIDLIAVFDRDLRYITINQYAVDVFKKRKEDFIGKQLTEVFPELASKPIVQNLKRAFEGEFIHLDAYKSQVSDIYLENFFIPLKDNDGGVARVLLLGHDLTAVMSANQKLKEANIELEKSNRELEQFAYIASHDLQEPLRKIQVFAELSEKNLYFTDVAKRYLTKIMSSAARMTDLIKAVLEYSRVTRIQQDFVTVDLNRVFAQLKVDLELLIQEKKATIETENLPNIHGVPMQINQLFYNLLTNSLKFTEVHPHIIVKAHRLTEAEAKEEGVQMNGKSFTMIEFCDNGIGFEQQFADKIFSIFQRLHSSDKFEGTGIGLALCKKIVETHGGVISVKSEIGKGTCFFVCLPTGEGYRS